MLEAKTGFDAANRLSLEPRMRLARCIAIHAVIAEVPLKNLEENPEGTAELPTVAQADSKLLAFKSLNKAKCWPFVYS
jgi:hypothetical protein